MRSYSALNVNKDIFFQFLLKFMYMGMNSAEQLGAKLSSFLSRM